MNSRKAGIDRKNIIEFIMNYALYVVLAVLILVVIVNEPKFLSIKNFTNILAQSSVRLIIALGIAPLIILQGTDLSAGRIVGLSAVVSASLLQTVGYSSRMYPNLPKLPLILPLILAVIIAAVFATANGVMVAKLGVHPFIVTLGMQLVVYGVTSTYFDRPPLGAQPIGNLDKDYTGFAQRFLFRIPFGNGTIDFPIIILYAIIVTFIAYFIWNKTTLGKNMYAIGGNPEAAAVSGVNITRNIVIIYMIAGVLYGFAGFLEGGRVGSASNNLGANYELDAIAACVVGGVSFSGGVGTIPGVIIGVLILQVINYGLAFMGVSIYLQYIIKGIIIVTAVAMDVRKYMKKK